jgi:nicotinamide-nucleotide amidase
MFPDAIRHTTTVLLERYRRAGLRLTTAESCTGGLVAAALTAIAGSSDVVERGFVTYTNEAKEQLLGVPRLALLSYGAVSEPVARAMAEGALRESLADVAVSVTGIAGPGGATSDKPVGLVHFGVARRGRETLSERHIFTGDRDSVRAAALDKALALLRDAVDGDVDGAA